MRFLIVSGFVLLAAVLAVAFVSASSIGTITTIAGTGTPCYACSGCCDYTGPADSARINGADAIYIDLQGNVYIGDQYTIKKLSPDSSGVYSVSIVAGRFDSVCFNPTDTCGDGGDAKLAGFRSPQYTSRDTKGNFYIIDNYNTVNVGRLRKLTPDGSGGYKISTIPIPGNPNQMYGLSTDLSDNVYVADSGNGKILKINPSGSVIKTFGTGVCLGNPNICGDGGPADKALLNLNGITVDKLGNIYLVEFNNNRIRKIFSQDIDTNGDGTPDFKKDYIYTITNDPYLSNLHSISVDSSGNLYTLGYAKAIMLTPDKTGNYIITTIAGTGEQAYSGDSGPATSAKLKYPQSVAVDSGSNIYIGEQYRVRKITGPIPTPVPPSPSPSPSPSPTCTPPQCPAPPAGCSYVGNTLCSCGTLSCPSPSPKTSPTPLPQFQWKVYKPSDGLYEIKYPDKWELSETSTATNFIESKLNLIQNRIFIAAPLTGKFADVIKPFEDVAKNVNGDILSTENTVVDGRQAVVYTLKPTSTSDGILKRKIAFVDAGEKVLKISVDSESSKSPIIEFAFSEMMKSLKINVQTSTPSPSPKTSPSPSPSPSPKASPTPPPSPKPEPPDLLGNNGPASQAKLYLPYDVFADLSGNVYIADTFNNMVRKVDAATKTMTLVSSKFSKPSGVFAKENMLYVADTGNNMVKRLAVIAPLIGGGSGPPIAGGSIR